VTRVLEVLGVAAISLLAVTAPVRADAPVATPEYPQFLAMARSVSAVPAGALAPDSRPRLGRIDARSPSALRQRLADATYSDSVGDAQLGVADIGGVSIADSNGTIGVGVSYADRTCASTGNLVFFDIDVDQNPATGNSLGSEVLLFVDAPANRRGVARWDGSLFQPILVQSLQAGCDTRGFDYWTFAGSEIGVTTGFNFFATACVDAARTQCGDIAPNSPPLWNYQLSTVTPLPQPQPPPPPQPPKPQPPPQRTLEDAPFLPKRGKYVGTSIRHGPLATRIYATMKVAGGGRQLQVACWSPTDWRSVVGALGGRVTTATTVLMGFWHAAQRRFLHLSPRACKDIQALLSTRRGNGQRAYAVTVALHETAHMYGVRNEAEASCYAVQLVYYFARRIGISPRAALRLERLAVRTTRAGSPRGYWDARRCRDGGAWDLDDTPNLDY
jgi:hypothetical protein